MKFSEYNPEEFYDEMFEARNRPQSGARLVTDRLGSLSEGELRRRQEAAELSMLHMGITLTFMVMKRVTRRCGRLTSSRA